MMRIGGALLFAVLLLLTGTAAQGQQPKNSGAVAEPTPAVPPAVAAAPQVIPTTTNHKSQTRWQRAFAPDFWSNWFLVAVGIGAIVAALYTLGTLERQTAATEKNVEAVVNSERSWIMTDIRWHADVGDAPTPTQLRVVEHSGTEGDQISLALCWRWQNDGRTPAWITDKQLWLRIVQEAPPSEPDLSGPFTFSGPEPLGIGKSSRIFVQPVCDGTWPRRGEGRALILYGVVKYRDVFGTHETWCGYGVVGGGDHPRLERLAGYPEYNRNT